MQQRLDAMFQHSLAECLPLALEMIEPKPEYLTLTPAQQMLALLAVGKFGSEENIAAIEPFLEDKRECLPRQQINGPGGELAAVQIRDVALASLLRLTGQEPVAYGFLHARPLTKLYRVPVGIGEGQLNVAFTHIEEGIAVPMPSAAAFDSYVIYVGFDALGGAHPAKQPAKKRVPKQS